MCVTVHAYVPSNYACTETEKANIRILTHFRSIVIMREIVKKVLINDSIDPIKMPGTEVSFPRQEYDMKLEALIQNMTDQIKEAQLKLGYARETMRLYYPLSSLNAMLEMQETDIRELAKKIRHELEAKKEKMGDTQIRIHADRIVFTIPPDFVEYVHEQVPEPPFLKELIQLFREKHACTKEEITAVFEKFGAYECRQMPDGMDFDYVIYFTDSSIDAYDYCIREEMGHTIYHRFARADFEALMTIQ